MYTGQWPVLNLSQKQDETLVHLRSVSNPSPPNPPHMIFDMKTKSISTQSKPSTKLVPVPIEHYDVGNQDLILRSTMCYYQPIQRNQATFDGFVWSGKGLGVAVVFQATVSGSHTVKKSGLVWLLKLAHVKKVWYVIAVTPADLHIEFILEKGVNDLIEKEKWFHIKIKPEDLV